MARWIARLFDLREGEGRLAAQAFITLFLIIAGHTMLETARDALFLSKLPVSDLNLSYIAVAALSFVVIAASNALTARVGRRNTLVISLAVVAYVVTLLHHFAPSPQLVLAFYVFSGLVGAVLTPQFWTLAAQIFTISQGRRLFGPIASGGVVGGVAGAGTAAAVLRYVPVTALMPISAALFIATGLVVTTIRSDDAFAQQTEARAKAAPIRGTFALLRENPFLVHLGALVALSTAAVLTVDYLFKSTAARSIAPEDLGEFFARYYALLNGASFLVQLLVAGRLVKRLGVVGTVGIMPFLLLGGGIASLLSGGLLLVVLLTKGVDGSLRHSLNRVATELLYLPLPGGARDRGKALIDTVLGRVTQAIMAGVLFALATNGHATPFVLAAIIAALSLGWLIVAVTLRRPYLDLFRRALAEGTLGTVSAGTLDELDLSSAEAVVEALASLEPERVVAAMNLLEQKRRGKLIPALVLYHDAEPILVRALEIFATSGRKDWIPLAERLLSKDTRENVRIAVVRALSRSGVVSALERAAEDPSFAVQAYAAFQLALHDTKDDLLEHPLIAAVIAMPGDHGGAARRGLMNAIADTPDPRAVNVLLQIASGQIRPQGGGLPTARMVREVSRAMMKIKDPRFIPLGIARLALRDGRDAVRDLLVSMGEPALDALVAALKAPSTPRRVRLHIPRTIARFGSQRACDVLTEALVDEKQGLVRFQVLGGLGRLVAENEVKVDRVVIEREARKNLVEHLRMLSYRVAIGSGPKAAGSEQASPGARLLEGLLEDKVTQALERAFRLLKVAHKREDIHRVHDAVRSSDRRARANAAEFIDTLLARGDQQELRSLFRLVVDDIDPKERVARAARWLVDAPRTRAEALTRLVAEPDEALAVVAAYHALTLGDEPLRATIERARGERPSLEALGERFFGGRPLAAEAHGA